MALTSLLDYSSSPLEGESDFTGIHKPVMVEEVIEKMEIKKDGVYVDATYGRGGHAAEMLRRMSSKGCVYALDKDPEAVKAAKLINDKRLFVKHGSFTELFDSFAPYFNYKGLDPDSDENNDEL